MNPERTKVLIALAASPEGRVLKEYLEEQLALIDKVSDLDRDPFFAQRALGRAEATTLLRKVLSIFIERKTQVSSKSQYE